MSSTSAFIRGGLEKEESILVVVSGTKVELLREELGRDAQGVDFADMSDVGANPARIIPAWYDFVAEHATGGRRIRGIGEPIDPERSPDALVECQRHESLLNLAFADATAWWLLCPYDTNLLDAAVIEEALASHPWVMQEASHRPSPSYRDLDTIAKPFDLPLPQPSGAVDALYFGPRQLDRVRDFVAQRAMIAGLDAQRTADLVLSVNEVATNSLRHGGGRGDVRVWKEPGRIVCEVRDAGLFNAPLVGRKRPEPGQEGGFGVWLVHQLCDLVQMRTFTEGSVVRLHMSLTPAPAL